MKKIDKIKISPNATIRQAMKVIDEGALQIALVIGKNGKLLGTITDGDIRRGLLKGFSLNDRADKILFTTPTIANINDSREYILNIGVTKKIKQIPVADDSGKIVGIELIDEFLESQERENAVVLMVGGLGKRLNPLTNNTPKPLLNVGDKPILQIIIDNFRKNGFKNFILCVNFQSHRIKKIFGDGRKLGVNIKYVKENSRLGTAGALGLLKGKLDEPFFVMNGDILTNLNMEHLLDFHLANNADATMCVKEYDVQVPYGVVNIAETQIVNIKEKPRQKFYVNAGIYILNPDCLRLIPKNRSFDMPALFKKIIASKKKATSFPIREYWLDIGHIKDFRKANKDYKKIFNV